MPQQNYLDELTPAFTPIISNKRGFPLFIMSRRTPVVRIARRKQTLGNLFALFIFVILKALPKLSAKIMRSVRCAPGFAQPKNYASADVRAQELINLSILHVCSALLLILNSRPQ
ncbi:Uncharacterised protein [Citrobacter freundii]|nr:Uncharacterised protein [Citrobacter freundii]